MMQDIDYVDYEEKSEKAKKSSKKKSKSRSTVPATIPVVTVEDGVEWISFTYSAKGTLTEYKIRTDIDHIDLEEIPHDFKLINCVYPRAFCTREEYQGNRWDYETTVNELGWKLCYMNPDSLCEKRGLIQRAVDSFRNRFPEMRSRRVVRQEKLINGTLRKRGERIEEEKSEIQIPPPPVKRIKPVGSWQVFETIVGGVPVKHRVRVDIENVTVSEIPRDFCVTNCVFPRAFNVSAAQYSFGPPARWEYETSMNELAWKLAWLNPTRLAGRKCLLQRAIDFYRTRATTATIAPRPGKRMVQQLQQLSHTESTQATINQQEAEALQAATGLLAVSQEMDSDAAAALLHNFYKSG